MSYIKKIPYNEAEGKLKKLYNRVKGPNNNVDNVLMIHSLRPHTLNGHMVLYKSVLHHIDNTFEKWYLEALGTYVSLLNECNYCFEHHAEGLRKNLDDQPRFETIYQAIKEMKIEPVFDQKQLAGAEYAHKLTLDHTSINREYIQSLRDRGFDDGEILEVNQVVSYFNYVNRMVVGLGVDTVDDIIGLSPSNHDESDNWSHT
ncbi:MAG: putative peroxidase-related enzyme [Saprospiraceae bacterium]|jgi:uncharacterized peroxidase-related enzyme|tara:strand:- start:376 stop:981 length:606 start_codon:yes stop_codon:yes gene_type:complete